MDDADRRLVAHHVGRGHRHDVLMARAFFVLAGVWCLATALINLPPFGTYPAPLDAMAGLFPGPWWGWAWLALSPLVVLSGWRTRARRLAVPLMMMMTAMLASAAFLDFAAFPSGPWVMVKNYTFVLGLVLLGTYFSERAFDEEEEEA